MDSNTKELMERVNKCCDAKPISKQEFINSVGIKETTFSKLESLKPVSKDVKTKINKWLKIREDIVDSDMNINRLDLFGDYDKHKKGLKRFYNNLEIDGKCSVFINGNHLYNFLSQLNGRKFDFSKLSDWFNNHGNIVNIKYYTAITKSQLVTVSPLLTYLSNNGYDVYRTMSDYPDGTPIPTGFLDTCMSVDIMEASDYLTDVVIITNSFYMKYAIKKLKNKGIRVTLIGLPYTKTLKEECTNFLSIGYLISELKLTR